MSNSGAWPCILAAQHGVRGMLGPSRSGRAQGMPGARCTRGLVCALRSTRTAHEHTGSAEAVRHPLRNGFTAYFALSSGTGLSCPRRLVRNFSCDLASASGGRDHATSPYATMPFVFRHPASTATPASRVVTIAMRPSCRGGMAHTIRLICVSGKAKYFLLRGWTNARQALAVCK